MKALGNLFIVIGCFFILVIIAGIASDSEKESGESPSDTLAGVMGGLIFALPCLYLGRHFIRKSKVQNANIIESNVEMTATANMAKSNTHVNSGSGTDASIENTDYEIKLIKLAKENDGYVSRVDVVLAFNIPSKKAQFIIDELYAEGLFDIHLTKNGSTLYKLRNYCSAEERETASSLLD